MSRSSLQNWPCCGARARITDAVENPLRESGTEGNSPAPPWRRQLGADCQHILFAWHAPRPTAKFWLVEALPLPFSRLLKKSAEKSLVFVCFA
jgi:hypothetical protein